MNWSEKLKPFVRRVRMARGWKGLAIGLTAGGAAGFAWVVLDWTIRWYTDWPQLAAVVGAGGVLGMAAGILWPLSAEQVARSLDRRAGLKDRLATALEKKIQPSEFEEIQEQDAAGSLGDVQPSNVYPIKVGKWQMSGAACAAAAFGMFGLTTSDIILPPDAKKAKEEAAKIAAGVERVAKELEEKKPKDGEAAKAQEKLARDMKEFAREVRRARLNKEEAMQKANELAKEAQKVAQDRSAEVEQKMETARDSIVKMKLEKAGINPEQMKKNALSPEEQKALNEMMQKQGMNPSENENAEFDQKVLDQLGLNELNADMLNMTQLQRSEMMEEMAKELSELQKKAAEGKLSEADKKRMEQLKKLMESLKFSEEALKGLRELMESKEFKELQKLIQEMAKAQEKMQQQNPGEQPELTEEDLERMKEQMEKMLEALEDPEMREQMKKQMEEMLEALKSGQMTLQQCANCMGLLGLGMSNGMPGASGPGSQPFFPNTGKITKTEEGLKTKGEGMPLATRGQRDDKRGSETYVEIKAPTTNGSKSSVPYSSVLPKYSDRAESALGKSKVPKKHEDRVRNYFDSLADGNSDKASDGGKK